MNAPGRRVERGGLRRSFRTLWQRLRGGELSRGRAAASVAVGLFIGSLPAYGLHLPMCLAVCLPLRLDAVIAYFAANISNPLIAPFLLTLEVEVGARLLTGHSAAFDIEQARRVGIAGFVAQAALGSVVVGAALAALGALVAALLVRGRKPTTAFETARARTIERYRDAAVGERCYVSAKLHTDPLARELACLDQPLGSVVDVGCGRGQFALLLLELGKADDVLGFDWDPRKVAVAEAAALGAAHFYVADSRSADLPKADTILVLDVLHYLTTDEQDRLLERLADRIRPGGRLLIRELDSTPALPSRVARFAERVGARFGYNRAATLAFRTLGELSQTLEVLGFSLRAPAQGSGANVLLVAERKHVVHSSLDSTTTVS